MTLDTSETTRITREAADYLTILIRIGPIIAVGGVVAVITHIHQIIEQSTVLKKILTGLSVLGVGCVSGGVVVLALPLLWGNPTPEMDILAAAIAGSAGQKGFDLIAKRFLGQLSTSDEKGL